MIAFTTAVTRIVRAAVATAAYVYAMATMEVVKVLTTLPLYAIGGIIASTPTRVKCAGPPDTLAPAA